MTEIEGFVVKASVVEDAQIARNDLVLQHGSGRDVDPVSVVGDDDHSSL
uniref:Uncharacterized protein n=1 Tax=Anguilla anguilla TaxID=7936 RepID=A0A0E9XNH6_ANGAN